MSKILFTFIFISIVFPFQVNAEVAIEGETEYVDLIKGVYQDKKFVDLPDETVFDYEDKKFTRYVDVIYDNDRKVFRFKPKREGSATIRLVNRKDRNLILKQIKITVQQSNLDKVAKEIKSLLGEIEGIEIKILNNKVIVDGYILLAKDLNRIAMVLSHYDPQQVVSIVRLSPLTRKKIAERIEAEIDNPNIYVTVVNDFFILEGSESWAGEKKRAGEIAQAHVSDILTKVAEKNPRGGSQILSVRKADNPIINNIAEVPPPKEQAKKMIQVVVHYVALSKNYSRGFNFSWAPTISDNDAQLEFSADGGSTSNVLSSLTATISNLLPRLNWAREHGHARILDTMNVTVQEGEKGTVTANKTLTRFRTGQLGAVQPLQITANVSTSVTPTIDPAKRENVNLDLNVQIGEATDDGLETNTNSVQTKLTVRDKQSAAVGGLLRSTSSTTYNRTPADNAASIFRLGAAKDLGRGQSQFVIFVTPIIKVNASQGIERIKKKFRLDK
jgi:pilus assembly protein CpaC